MLYDRDYRILTYDEKVIWEKLKIILIKLELKILTA